jgi:uncharacterized membrane protein YfcA
MPSLTTDLLIILGAFLVAGLVKGVAGLGLPTVAIGLLSVIMPPAQAASLLVVPSLATNIWQTVSGPALGSLVRRLWPMQAAICLGAWTGSGLLTSMPPGAASGALGAALILYAAVGLSPVRLPDVPSRAEWWLGPVSGFVTGLMMVATGVFVIPMVPYLQALEFKRDELVQALGISFTVSTLALAGALASVGAADLADFRWSVLAVAPALAGMFVGQSIRQAINPDVFRRCFFVALLLLGAHLALRSML